MKLYLILGPMFSGKSATLLRYISMSVDMEKRCLLIHYPNRNVDISRMYTLKYSNYDIKECTNYEEIKLAILQYKPEYLFIDEVQFFDGFNKIVYENYEIQKIYMTGLNGDYMQKMFNEIILLLPYCSIVPNFDGICKQCKKSKSVVSIKDTTNLNVNTNIDLNGVYSSSCIRCLKSNHLIEI